MNVVEVVMGLLFLLFIITSIIYVCKIVLIHFDRSAFHLAVVIVCFDFWVFTISLFFFESLLVLPSEVLRSGYYLGNIALFIGLIGFSFMMSRPVFLHLSHTFSYFSIFGYSMLIALNLVDIILPNSLFFIFASNMNEWELSMHPLALGLVISAVLFTMISIILNVLITPALSENHLVQQRKQRYLLTSILMVIWGLNFIFFTLTVVLKLVPLKIGFFIFICSLIIPFFLCLYFSGSLTFFFLIAGMQSKVLLEQGFIGYFLASFTDFGPAPINLSLNFRKRMKLADEVYENFSVSGMSPMVAYEYLGEKVSLLPIPTSANIYALSFAFYIDNPNLEDGRLVE
ncbi:MAG: hypothetical protein ACFFBD_02735, partial [Candidatus Hodarchaeota archaeon]